MFLRNSSSCCIVRPQRQLNRSFSESQSTGVYDIIACTRWCHWCGCFSRTLHRLSPTVSICLLLILSVGGYRCRFLFFTSHVKYNADIAPACYSNPLIFMSYNSRVTHKSRGLLILLCPVILRSLLFALHATETCRTLSIINGGRDMWYLEIRMARSEHR